jgi:twitching motility protein PilJ
MAESRKPSRLISWLGALLALVLLGAAALLYFSARPTADDTSADAQYSRVAALVQSAAVAARRALAGDLAAIESVAGMRTEIAATRQAIGSDPAARTKFNALFSNPGGVEALLAAIDNLMDRGQAIPALNAGRERIARLSPQLLVAAQSLWSGLPQDAVGAGEPYMVFLQETTSGIQRTLDTIGGNVPVGESFEALGAGEAYLSDLVNGLTGVESALGIPSLAESAASEDIDTALRLLEETRLAIESILQEEDRLTAMQDAVRQIEVAAAVVVTEYEAAITRQTPPSLLPSYLPLALVGASLALLLILMIAVLRTRAAGDDAAVHAEQNERNQQAILRLLDELTNLADGDLTVQATVTEDITGAIADSINYAIEALRELVVTISRSSVLVDDAAKQSEATAHHLVRAAETQAKQAVAASQSITKMRASVEEVTGNAERSSDVARHAVEVAHKGGEAVRRTIEGMNAIRETIQDTSKRIKRLGESSQEIGNIVELIEEIAEQTNILALNASIEASRAGEASRGFAVVADEVQKLAERSTTATRKIEVLVSTIQSDTNEAIVSMERSTTDVVGGALLAENAGAALVEIEQVSHQIASLVQNILGSAREQTRAASDISRNINVLSEVSSKAKQLTTATSSSISKLSELASQLRQSVSGFVLPAHEDGTQILSSLEIARAISGSEPEPHVSGDVNEARASAAAERASDAQDDSGIEELVIDASTPLDDPSPKAAPSENLLAAAAAGEEPDSGASAAPKAPKERFESV